MKFINGLYHGRSAEVRDVIIDSVGAVTGIVIINKKERRKQE